MKAIVNVDSNWGIGLGDKLINHIPADMKFFKEKTIGNIVVMGRATLETFPGGNPLKDRVNIVLSKNPDFNRDDVIICRSIEELFDILKRHNTNLVYVIGGESVYRQLLPYCDTVYATKVKNEKTADKYFPNLDKDEDWVCVKESDEQDYNGVKYTFATYKTI